MSNPRVEVRFAFPVNYRHEGQFCVGFYQWLPTESDAIEVAQDGLTIRGWIDRSCLQFGAKDITDEDISRLVSIHCKLIRVVVVAHDVDAPLADHIVRFDPEADFTPEHTEAVHDPDLVVRHTAFARRVHDAGVKYVNRLIGYLRAVKGQYWVDHYEADPRALRSDLVKARAQVRVQGGEWLRLTANEITVIRNPYLGRERFVKADDWRKMADWMRAGEREPLVGNLLCIADELWARGHMRAAVMEAVCALEVAVNDFAARPASESLLKRFSWRTDFRNLRKHVERFGLTKTVNYLLPVLLTADDVPDAVLRACQEAVEVRGNVVHNRQVKLNEQEVERLLRSIRQLCSVLTQGPTAEDK